MSGPIKSKEPVKRTTDAIAAFAEGEDDFEFLGLDSEGRFCIPVDLRGEELYAPFSGRALLVDSFFSYVEEASHLSLRPLSLELKIEEERLSEKDFFRRAYVRHYEAKKEEARHQRKRDRLQSFFLLLAGIFFFVCYGVSEYFLYDHDYLFFIPEIISIVAWVFVWAATEKLFFDGRTAKIEELKAKRLEEATLTFYCERK